jgi:hypothetical protein
MITGVITADREAVIRFAMRDQRSGQEREIQAVIDTGFNGYLTLPDALASTLGLGPSIATPWSPLATAAPMCYASTKPLLYGMGRSGTRWFWPPRAGRW